MNNKKDSWSPRGGYYLIGSESTDMTLGELSDTNEVQRATANGGIAVRVMVEKASELNGTAPVSIMDLAPAIDYLASTEGMLDVARRINAARLAS